MAAIEIVLILIGITFMIGSFFVTEKLSEKDLNQIAELSEKEISRIANKELAKAAGQVEEQVDAICEEAAEKAEREMDKQTNEKIMQIGDYSDTVLENMNKTHNEIMFLYSMLNDKHTELTELAGELSKQEARLQEELAESEESAAKAESESQNPENKEEPAAVVTSEEIEQEDSSNHNERILELYKQGKPLVDIARELGLGLGEVKLVVELFRGEA